MRRWWVGAGLAMVCAAPAYAKPKPYDMVSRSDASAYAAISRLDARGYFSGTPTSFSGDREFTRYEFAVAVERLSPAIRSRVLAARDAAGLREDLRDLGTLIEKFSSEIEDLGPRVNELQQQIDVLLQRVDRLESTETPGPDLEGKLARPKSYGTLAAFKTQRAQNWVDSVSRSGVMRAPFNRGFDPQLRASAGPLNLGVQVEGPDQLDNVRLRLDNPADSQSYRARLDMPLGGFTLSAFYMREGSFRDRFMLANPYGPLGPTVGYGGGVSGTLLDNVNFLLESASIRSLDDDVARAALSFRAGLNYEMGRGLRLGAGFEKTRQFGAPGLTTDLATYTLFLERNLGRNTTFSVIYRHFNPRGTTAGSASPDGSASTVVQGQFRF